MLRNTSRSLGHACTEIERRKGPSTIARAAPGCAISTIVPSGAATRYWATACNRVNARGAIPTFSNLLLRSVRIPATAFLRSQL